ncbi:alkane 1-monooxygenase [Marinobacter sp. F4216]|uniref:alkane 1-monooxygenase n=1 Tax=Marinobacter sp. F4216 TaxID=2874281 RepID=UPI001CBD3BDC|nr:alkane 1-monooxygenase [Marinobacter sp. F4216]MBZ2168714.1 alkane 1-monooxygenase [Marinobacter sp. F4216]
MFERIPPRVMIALKKVMFLLVFFVAMLPYNAWQMMQENGNWNLYAWWPLFVIFGIIPVVDHLVGKDSSNPQEDEVERLAGQRWYSLLTLLAVPTQLAVLAFGAWVFVTTEQFSLAGQIGWILSCGIISAILSINVGHELIHRRSRLENWAGGLLYASVCYAGFKVEHVRGHHVTVSTSDDASSARFGQSLYHFLPRAYLGNVRNAWKLEAKRLKTLGLPALHWRNELIWWNAVSVGFAVAALLIFGWAGLVFYLGVSWMSFTTLEIINYIEHYGLHRRKLPNGGYERTTPAHSWNSNYLITNLGLFHLQRHSDHHAFPTRRYQVLRHYEGSPQLPTGYAGMYVMALIPPLWFWIMNPRVKAYYEGEEWQLSAQEFEQSVA